MQGVLGRLQASLDRVETRQGTALSAIEERISALEGQVLYEAGHLPSLPEVEVEMTGRAAAARGRQPQSVALR